MKVVRGQGDGSGRLNGKVSAIANNNARETTLYKRIRVVEVTRVAGDM